MKNQQHQRVNSDRKSSRLGQVFLATLTVLLSLTSAQKPFLDCKGTLGSVVSDTRALDYVKEVHEAKQFKFPSECLTILLQKNFEASANYLLEEYYSKTQIDTEVIVRAVSSDVKYKQNYILFKLLRQRNEKWRSFNSELAAYPKPLVPMVYQAQSPDDVHLLVRMQESYDDLDCEVTYENSVQIFSDHVLFSCVCFVSEEDAQLYTRRIDLPQAINPDTSYFQWESQARVHLQLKKANGPSYWPQLVKLDTTTGRGDEDSAATAEDLLKHKVAMWKTMHVKYIEQVEDYMTSQKQKAAQDEL